MTWEHVSQIVVSMWCAGLPAIICFGAVMERVMRTPRSKIVVVIEDENESTPPRAGMN